MSSCIYGDVGKMIEPKTIQTLANTLELYGIGHEIRDCERYLECIKKESLTNSMKQSFMLLLIDPYGKRPLCFTSGDSLMDRIYILCFLVQEMVHGECP